jgi:hypothetical protein
MGTTDESLDKLERRVREGLSPDDQFILDALKEGVAVEELLASEGGRALLAECVNTGKAAFSALMTTDLSERDERRHLLDLRVAVGMARMLSRLVGAGLAAERCLISDEAGISSELT